MMSNTLAKAIELARRLPEKDQEALGVLLIEEMRSENRWAKLFGETQDLLSDLADEALAEHKEGKTKPWD